MGQSAAEDVALAAQLLHLPLERGDPLFELAAACVDQQRLEIYRRIAVIDPAAPGVKAGDDVEQGQPSSVAGGELRFVVAEGEVLTADLMSSVDWFVQGVTGSPK